MKLIAIESSGKTGSVAAWELDSSPTATPAVTEIVLPEDRRSAQTLAASLERLLNQVNWRPDEVEYVAVPVGPGSFTGLRVGVTTAKMFAYGAGAKVVPVNTLDVLAHQGRATGVTGPIATVMDAQRREVFSARYLSGEPKANTTANTTIEAIDQWLASLQPGDLVIGPYLAKLKDRLPVDVEIADESLWQPMATSAAHLAIDLVKNNATLEPWQLLPDYYRKSAAEEKAEAQS